MNLMGFDGHFEDCINLGGVNIKIEVLRMSDMDCSKLKRIKRKKQWLKNRTMNFVTKTVSRRVSNYIKDEYYQRHQTEYKQISLLHHLGCLFCVLKKTANDQKKRSEKLLWVELICWGFVLELQSDIVFDCDDANF
jgi:hypothetical protein